MYSIKDLRALAKVTRGQINQWKKLELLPEPTLVKSRRGKPTEMYPQETLGAVIVLSRWYHIVRDPDKARIFLWLEGVEYTGVDPQQVVREWCANRWCEFQQSFPSLRPLEEIQPGADKNEPVLEEIEEQTSREGDPDIGGLLPLVLGLLSEGEVSYFDVSVDPADTALGLLTRLERDQLKTLSEVGYDLKGGIADDPQLIARIAIPNLMNRLPEVDWRFVRAFWAGVNALCEQESLSHRSIRFWREARDLAYSKHGPQAVLTSLALIDSNLSEEAKRNLVESMPTVRR